jgi:hypothetical protein
MERLLEGTKQQSGMVSRMVWMSGYCGPLASLRGAQLASPSAFRFLVAVVVVVAFGGERRGKREAAVQRRGVGW